jgi:hypothetical protein
LIYLLLSISFAALLGQIERWLDPHSGSALEEPQEKVVQVSKA